MYAQAARLRGLSFEVASYTEQESGALGSVPVPIRNLLQPWRFAARLGRELRSVETVVLRDFLTMPLLLALPVLRPHRRRLLLLCVHNLQRAHQRTRDRRAFVALARAGFRFLLPESSAGLAEIVGNRRAESSLVLPLGATPAHVAAPTGPKDGIVVGVVGAARREKGGVDTVDRIARAVADSGLPATVLVGRPGSAGNAPADRSVTIVDTTEELAYRRALATCSVVFLDHSREDYAFRTSGTILDAAAAHAAVLCPDLPHFRAQVEIPEPIGATYASEAELPTALRRAVDLQRRGPEAFEAYLRFRSAAELAERLEAFVGTGAERRS